MLSQTIIPICLGFWVEASVSGVDCAKLDAVVSRGKSVFVNTTSAAEKLVGVTPGDDIWLWSFVSPAFPVKCADNLPLMLRFKAEE